MIPKKFRAEFDEILSMMSDDSVSPTEYLDRVDDLFQRMCDDQGIDFREAFGSLKQELLEKMEQGDL